MSDLQVQFTDDIPKIEREGAGQRSSKYDELLEACVKNKGKAAKIQVDSQGQASSRSSSIRTAAERHSAEKNGEGAFIVATRSGEADDEFYVFTKYVDAKSEEYGEEMKRRKAAAERASKKAQEKKEGGGENKPRKVAKKAQRSPAA